MDLPVIQFIQERLAESDTLLETRKGSGYYDLFIKPQELILQPFVTAMETILIAQSVKRMLALDDPDDFNEEYVDSTASNVYVDRDVGDYARTIARVFYEAPVDRELPAFGSEFTTTTGLSFFNEFDFIISSAEMSLQKDGNLFFMDVPVRAQAQGSDYNIEPGDLTSFVNDSQAVSVTNTTKAEGGLARETNTHLLTRTKNSIGVRDLETIKGINAIINEKFPAVQEIQAIGFGDPEMMRDIVYNAHVGGNTDVYLKFPALQTKDTIIRGLTFDFTREVHRNTHIQLTATTFSDPDSDLMTPNIVSPSVTVSEDIIETSAFFLTQSIPASTGINLSSGQWIKLKANLLTALNIKVAGATPTATQRFEIINSINATMGLTIAKPYAIDQIIVSSPTIGANSLLELSVPDGLRSDGTALLIASLPGSYPPTATYMGTAADIYIENVDYQVEYVEGKIINLGGAILSGTEIAGSAMTPATGGIIVTGMDTLEVPSPPTLFQNVRPGDTLNITTVNPATGVAVGPYVISEKVSNTKIRVQNKYGIVGGPTAGDTAVQFYVVSNQVVVIDYKYNPLSVDIGPNVLLADGVTRGIRPGRSDFTIKDVAFIDIISIEEVDPDTEEPLGVILDRSAGYGSGGYGEGGYGGSSGGQYELVVNRPTERFSAFEDSMILFSPEQFGKSFKVTYYTATEIADVHAIARSDLERVTGADVLPKHFIPAFVDIDFGIRRDPTNIATPANADLALGLRPLIDGILAGNGLQSSELSKYLELQGVSSVQIPFTMRAEIINTDGTTTAIESEDVLIPPDVVLPRDTPNFGSPRITHMISRDITVSEVP